MRMTKNRGTILVVGKKKVSPRMRKALEATGFKARPYSPGPAELLGYSSGFAVLTDEPAPDLLEQLGKLLAPGRATPKRKTEKKTPAPEAVLAKELAEDLGLTRKEIAGALEVNESTFHRWLTGETRPLPALRGRIYEIAEIRTHLLKVLKKEGVKTYLTAKNELLGGRTPLNLLSEPGGVDKVLRDIEGMEAGVFV